MLAAQTALDLSPAWAIAALAGGAFFLVTALVYPGGMGMGDVKLALLLGAMLGTTLPVALSSGSWLRSFPRSCSSPATGSRHARMGVPLAPFLALGALVALFAGHDLLHLYLSLADAAEAARLVASGPGKAIDGAGSSGSEVARAADAVTTALPDRRRRLRRAGSTDLDRARRLAESHGLPLVDLAVTGISPEAIKLVPLTRARARASPIPYAVDERSLRIALTDPDNLHGDRRAASHGSPARRVRGRAARGRACSRCAA